MDTERWKQVKEIFHAAIALVPEERAAFLDKACRNSDDLRSEVQSLIDSHERTGSFIDSPVFAVAAHLLADDRALLRDGQGRERPTRQASTI